MEPNTNANIVMGTKKKKKEEKKKPILMNFFLFQGLKQPFWPQRLHFCKPRVITGLQQLALQTNSIYMEPITNINSIMGIKKKKKKKKKTGKRITVQEETCAFSVPPLGHPSKLLVCKQIFFFFTHNDSAVVHGVVVGRFRQLQHHTQHRLHR